MRHDSRGRRSFLCGAGGVALAVPFLSSLAPRTARAAERPPIRFFNVVSKFGRVPKAWYPAEDPTMQVAPGVHARKLTEIAGPISTTLGTAFDPFRDKLALVRGLDGLAHIGLHNFTFPTTASLMTRDGSVSTCEFPYSIDCVLEESKTFYPTPWRLGALRLIPHTGPWRDPRGYWSSYSVTSKSGVPQKLPYEWNPLVVYDALFKNLNVSPTQTAAADPVLTRMANGTARVMEDYKQARSSRRISADDRIRLDNYIELLAGFEKRARATTPILVGGTKPSAPAAPGTVPAGMVHAGAIDIAVAALACGLTRVVMYNINNSSDNPADGDGVTHDAAHNHGSGRHLTFTGWILLRVAEALRKLDAIREADGSTLLDNTLFAYTNEESNGSHTFFDVPVLLAGGQGKLRTGHYVDYRPRPFVPSPESGLRSSALGRPYNSLLVTMFHALGLGPADYQKLGKEGFGSYNVRSSMRAHYEPFIAGAARNQPLPFLYGS